MMHQLRNNAVHCVSTESISNCDDRQIGDSCQTKRSRIATTANLDDYIYELESRSDLTNSSMTDIGDNENALLSQLAQKEKDLILAAELGKALLERNEELSRANERITEEYSHKLELLEQEKYALRRKLEILEGECDGKIAELLSDLSCVRKELDLQHTMSRQTEHDKTKIVQELVEQNHRLTSELKQANESESLLASQLQSLREQFNVRRTNLNDHIDQLEGLREEINLLTKRKSDLEKRLTSLTQDRENLNMSLEESSDRIFLLEKQLQEQEQELRIQQKELEELRHANSQLHNKLDSMTRKSLTSDIHTINGHHSLFNEIEMSSESSTDDDLRSLNGHISAYSPDDEIECDDQQSSFSSCHNDCWKLRQELVEVYHQLRTTCNDLQRKRENSGAFNSTEDSGIPQTPEEIHANQVRVGLLRNVMRELLSLLNDSHSDYTDMHCLACQTLAEERLELEKLRKQVNQQTEDIKRKSENISEMKTKLTIMEAEMNAIKEERDLLKQDMEDSNELAKDEIVKRAWDVRDQAVARKNVVEIELAKTRIEVMHINSQLLETIQQKVELSQQLEQWQVDMQSLIDDQLRKKLTFQESGEKRRNDTNLNGSQYPNNYKTSHFVVRSSKFLRLWRHN